jgi:hypothetical protein
MRGRTQRGAAATAEWAIRSLFARVAALSRGRLGRPLGSEERWTPGTPAARPEERGRGAGQAADLPCQEVLPRGGPRVRPAMCRGPAASGAGRAGRGACGVRGGGQRHPPRRPPIGDGVVPSGGSLAGHRGGEPGDLRWQARDDRTGGDVRQGPCRSSWPWWTSCRSRRGAGPIPRRSSGCASSWRAGRSGACGTRGPAGGRPEGCSTGECPVRRWPPFDQNDPG